MSAVCYVQETTGFVLLVLCLVGILVRKGHFYWRYLLEIPQVMADVTVDRIVCAVGCVFEDYNTS